MNVLLEIKDLKTYFRSNDSVNKDYTIKAVDGVSFSIKEGEIFGIVGESGSGKTVTAQSIVKLVPEPTGRIVSGEIIYKGKDILKTSGEELRKLRGKEIAYMFQEPYTSLNPVINVEEQIVEVITTHLNKSYGEASTMAVELLEQMGISDAAKRIKDYPHMFSGGMRQRIALAMALSANPSLLIADEPTTMLDVTIQKQILDLLLNIKKSRNDFSIIFISHNLGIITKYCDRTAVMYAGKIQEISDAKILEKDAMHPYTKGLLTASKFNKNENNRVYTIPGQTPDLSDLPMGCKFCNRCAEAIDVCFSVEPGLIETKKNHFVRCHLYGNEKVN